jgi:DnaJ-class molecular chaperone
MVVGIVLGGKCPVRRFQVSLWRIPISCPRTNILFLSFSSQRVPIITDENPFDILGIPKSSSYKEVKSRFVELALANHPDTSQNQDSIKFIRLRKAFESIRESQDGGAEKRERDDYVGWTDEEFQAWFLEETGHPDVLFRIDLATRKEVVSVAKTCAQGGLDRGGMWEMARAMAEQEKSLRDRKTDFSAPIGIHGESTNTNPGMSRRKRRS